MTSPVNMIIWLTLRKSRRCESLPSSNFHMPSPSVELDYIFCWGILWSFARSSGSSKPITHVWFYMIGLNMEHNNCRKLLILRNCQIPHYVILPLHCHQVLNLELIFSSENKWVQHPNCALNLLLFVMALISRTTDLLILRKYSYLILKIFFQKNVSNLMWK